MNNIYSRPMFQNPQERAGGGIMAGVAPINMEVSPARMNMGGIISEEGAINPDLSITDWLLGGKQMEAIGAEGYLGSERMYDTTGQAIKDFIFDPDDPVDQATAALMVIPGVNIASRLLSMGLKTSRIIKQLKKVEQATKLPANISGKGATAVIAGDIALDPDVQAQIVRTGELIKSIPEKLTTPPEEEVISQGGSYPWWIDDPEQGGIANIATTIRQARDMKSPTFRRGDEDLAAVTVEDLKESGFESLKDYLNNMSFDEDEGIYVAKKNGGGEVENIQDRGVRNNNWLNIRYNPANDWVGQTGSDDSNYAQFEDPVYGLRAADRVLENYGKKHGINTLNDTIFRFAPPEDNNPSSTYAKFVADKMDIDVDDKIDLEDPDTRDKLITSMIGFETPDAVPLYSPALLRQARNFKSEDEEQGGIASILSTLKKTFGMSNGGEAEIPENIEDFLESSDLTMEEFLELPEKSKEAYVDVYQQRLEMMQDITGSGPVRAAAGLADLINVPFDALGEVYDDVMHSDLAKVIGITDPDEKKPEPDPMFGEDIAYFAEETAPTLEEVTAAGRPEPPAPIVDNTKEELVETEEEPGFFKRIAGGIANVAGRAAGFHLPDDEYRALIASSGRRKLGESRAEVYNRELAAIRDAESSAKLREAQADSLVKSDLEKDIEFIKSQFPEVTDPDELLSLYKQFTQSSSSLNSKDIMNLRKDLYKTYLDAGAGSPQRNDYDTYKLNQEAQNLASLPYEAWSMTKVNEQVLAITGTGGASDSSVIEMTTEELAT